MMMAYENAFLKAQGVFQRICTFLREASRDGLRMDQIERQLKPLLAEAGLKFLQEHVEECGDGDQGETVALEDRVLTRSETPQARRYLSIFGELSISRYVYSRGKKKPIEYSPVDARLGLPAGENSYVLEDFQQRLCVKSPYNKAVDDLQVILGTGVSARTAEHMNQQMGFYAKDYRLSGLTEENVAPPENEAELLVVAADGKGVLMRQTLEEQLREEQEATASQAEAKTPPPTPAVPPQRSRGRKRGKRKATPQDSSETPGRGKKKSRKQMAYVGAVYTIAPFPRTVDEVMDEIARRERAKDRPRPENKRVWAEMTRLVAGEPLDGRSSLFVYLAMESYLRDPQRQKPLICLMDGEEPLWSAKSLRSCAVFGNLG